MKVITREWRACDSRDSYIETTHCACPNQKHDWSDAWSINSGSAVETSGLNSGCFCCNRYCFWYQQSDASVNQSIASSSRDWIPSHFLTYLSPFQTKYLSLFINKQNVKQELVPGLLRPVIFVIIHTTHLIPISLTSFLQTTQLICF